MKEAIMTIRLRPDRVLFRFSGADAQKLLDDVLTTRVVAEPGPAKWWALLSPQGKIQAEGLIAWGGAGFWLDTHASAADVFFKRMRMYRLRAAVEIEDLRETHRIGWSPESNAGGEGNAVADGRAEGLGWRIVASAADAHRWQPADDEPAARRIAAGIAELGTDFPADQMFPHDIGMDLLQGVDFKKGCYVGQEVVSRMQHRGTARRRPVIVEGVPEGAASGAPILVGEREAGTIGLAAGGRAVGIVRLDRIEDGAQATVGGLPVELELPEWATYRFGEVVAEG
jgi:folate-binding protein YgfZ